jgi:hypothetical protein
MNKERKRKPSQKKMYIIIGCLMGLAILSFLGKDYDTVRLIVQVLISYLQM